MDNCLRTSIKPYLNPKPGAVFPDPRGPRVHMTYSLNSLKGGYIGDYIGGLL